MKKIDEHMNGLVFIERRADARWCGVGRVWIRRLRWWVMLADREAGFVSSLYSSWGLVKESPQTALPRPRGQFKTCARVIVRVLVLIFCFLKITIFCVELLLDLKFTFD